MLGYSDYSQRLPGGVHAKVLWRLLFMLITWVCFASPDPVLAAIHSCPDASGTVIFQDRPCPLKKVVATTVKTTQRYPFGMHESWFAIPDQATERAFCDKRGCECGKFEKKHNGALAQAVADSLYIDGSWHRYDESYEIWLNTATNSADNHVRRDEMLEASCEVMMSQVLLRDYATDVAATLKAHTRTAEERGFDIDTPCLQGIRDACRYLEYVNLYKRLKQDSKALKQARGAIMVELE